jgi:lipoprotein-releasing system ATP-binding protein
MAELPLLAVEGVVREYGDVARTRALDGVDLTLGPGELTALMGPSGSGKSTLLHIIGLLDRPTAGRVVLGGTDTTRLDERGPTKLRARMLGFIFQFHHLLPAFTALENVMLPAWGDLGSPSPEMRSAGEEILRAVGLGDRMHYRASHLSGGQQQRVALARRPPLVLADEPTGNLDTVSSREVFAQMRRFNQAIGTTFLVVTHDPRIADGCDRVVELVDDRVRSERTVPHAGAPG